MSEAAPAPTEQSLERQALSALRGLRAKIDELETSRREGIAIIGLACDFPGGVHDANSYWRLLIEQRCAIGEIPSNRIDMAAIFSSDKEAPGKTYSRWAGLLDQVDAFDAEFFGISPREASQTDPQQRIFLECVWHALEDAGIAPASLAGSPASVFVGATTHEYSSLQTRSVATHEIDRYSAFGAALNAIAGRVSHVLGLHGPSLCIDTACSSSLVAVDRACRSLRDGECDLAIAGGVSVIAFGESLIAASRWGMLSPSGRVRSFGMGDGFVRGEGCGVIVLKRLSAAQRAGDRVLGVILGSSVNHDGPGSGLTVPNGKAQAMLLRAALASAGLAPSAVGYVEAHGTGTRLGDPIEAEALGDVFAAPRDAPLQIGSVKTNLGHLEAAAGIAGLIKLVLSLGHGEIPAQLQDGPLSEHVRWSELPLEVTTQHRSWQPIAGRRIGGVSAFGFSGTNAHVIVEEAPPYAPQQTKQEDEGEVLVLSAKSEAALDRIVERYVAHLVSHPEQAWGDVCHTAAVGRTHFKHRVAMVAETRERGLELLRAYGRNDPSLGIERGQMQPGNCPRVGVSLGGQAVPYMGPDTRMGRAQALGEAYVAGREVDWVAWNRNRVRRRIALPGYAFERQRHWLTPSMPTLTGSSVSTPIATLTLAQQTGTKIRLNRVYETEWIPRPQQRDDLASCAGPWLILADRSGVGESLAHEISALRGSCFFVTQGEEYRQLNESQFTVRMTSRDDFARVLQSLPMAGTKLRIVHLWSLDAPRFQDVDAHQLLASQQLGYGSCLALVQAVVEVELDSSLFLITLSAKSAVSTRSTTAGPALWAMRRAVRAEHPNFYIKAIDLAGEHGDIPVSRVLLELRSNEELEVALNTHGRLVPRLVVQLPRTLAKARHNGNLAITYEHPSHLLSGPATYLITGGLGSLGLRAAEWLLRCGARSLILVSRHPHPESEQVVSRMKDAGASIRVVYADCAQSNGVRTAMKTVAAQAPLRGVIHCAGVLLDSTLMNQTWSSFREVVESKLQGAWNLHTETSGMPLDFFITFSSAAAIVGSAGQANYVAANAAMDALALLRRSQGLPALSINWGPWQGEGMAAGEASTIRHPGLQKIEAMSAFKTVEDLLGRRTTQAMVLPAEHGTAWFSSHDEAVADPFLDALKASSPTANPANPQPNPAAMQASPQMTRPMLIECIQADFAKVSGLKSPVRLSEETTFADAGLDSLMAVELRNALVTSLGRNLPDTVALNYPTVGALADYLLPRNSTESIAAPRHGTFEDKITIDAALQALSEEEAEVLLTQEIDRGTA